MKAVLYKEAFVRGCFQRRAIIQLLSDSGQDFGRATYWESMVPVDTEAAKEINAVADIVIERINE